MNGDVQIKQTVQEAAFLFPLQQSIVKKAKKVTFVVLFIAFLVIQMVHVLILFWFLKSLFPSTCYTHMS